MVLTGYNTDIEFAGTTYHVQTEDKGRGNPMVESLVYTSGEILYSRRTPYHDLVEQNVDKEAVATLMERQHRSIVDAVQTGGVERLTGKARHLPTDDDTTLTGSQEEVVRAGAEEPSLDQVILDYLESQRGRAHLLLRASTDLEFVYGGETTISVTAVDSLALEPQPDVKISVLFKSTSEPRRMVLAEGETDDYGCFTAETKIPVYAGGTSAVVISGNSDLGQSEMKHLVRK